MKIANEEKNPRVSARESRHVKISLADQMREPPSREALREARRAEGDAAPAVRQPTRAEIRKLTAAGVVGIKGGPPSTNKRVLARAARTAAAAEATATAAETDPAPLALTDGLGDDGGLTVNGGSDPLSDGPPRGEPNPK